MWVTLRRKQLTYVDTLGGRSCILDLKGYSLSKPLTGFLLSYKCNFKGQAGALCSHREKKTKNLKLFPS